MEIQARKLFDTELTQIPELIRTYATNEYNNGLGNMVTWAILGWFVLHAVSNWILNNLLKNLRYKSYIRARISESLWNLCVFSCYLLTNNIELSYKLCAVITFYLHCTFWDALFTNNRLQVACNALVVYLYTILYFTERLNTEFPLFHIYLCVTRIALEVTRLLTIFLPYKPIKYGIFMINLIVFIGSIVTFLPLEAAIDIYDERTFESYVVFTSFALWMLLELANSAVFHWFHHVISRSKCEYESSIIDCALFNGRSDPFFILKTLREEMKMREEKALLSRKPKNKNVMVMQTLKCMMTLKKKLQAKRQRQCRENDKVVISAVIDNDADDEEQTEEAVCNGKLQFNIQTNREMLTSQESAQDQ